PMGFCYPGKGKSGDLPPRKECAPQWHGPIFSMMPNLELKLVIGQYAQKQYLGKSRKKNLTETVIAYEEYLPEFFPLVHPSPLNVRWQKKNPWFVERIVPVLQETIKKYL
ncbi:MAG: uracil-DNA glycosylase family protein, partial [Bacteroidota bacterium]